MTPPDLPTLRAAVERTRDELSFGCLDCEARCKRCPLCSKELAAHESAVSALALAEREAELRAKVFALDSYELRDLPGYGGGSTMKNVGPPRFSDGPVRYLIHGDYLRLEDVDEALTSPADGDGGGA